MVEWFIEREFEKIEKLFQGVYTSPEQQKSAEQQKIELYAEKFGKAWNSDPSLYLT